MNCKVDKIYDSTSKIEFSSKLLSAAVIISYRGGGYISSYLQANHNADEPINCNISLEINYSFSRNLSIIS